MSVLIVGHGSRDAGANQEFEALVARYRARHPALAIAHGYVELARPTLAEALATLAAAEDGGGDEVKEIVVVPLFLFAAGHVKNDIPLALEAARRAFPRTRFRAARALGVHPALVGLAVERMRAAAPPGIAPGRTAAVLVGRGASDPDANGDFCKVARLVGEGQGLAGVAPAFIGITTPLFDEAIEAVARTRPEAIVVVPYFLFAGRLIEKLARQVAAFGERCPWIKTSLAEHLGAEDRLLDLVDERIAEARTGAAPLPCDTCQYRVPISGVAGQVGGLRAMLWSLRHSFTHGQAMPHEHAHAPLAKHVLICGNVDCAEGGSIALLAAVRRLLKDSGRERDIRVTRTSCMGRCGEGPTVAIYPDGIWYRNVREHDAEELVREHLLRDRLVARLVDNIMQ